MFRASYTLRARVSLALYVHIRNAMQEVVAQSKQGREQSPLVEQGMHEPLEIYKPRASFAWCYLIRLIFSPNPIRQRTSHIALPPCTLPASRHVGDTRAHP